MLLQFRITVFYLSFLNRNFSWIFSIITPVFSVTWSFRNHSNVMICCSRHNSNYYQFWKQLCFFIFLWKLHFQDCFMNRELLFEREILKLFTLTFIQFNVLLINKYSFLSKEKNNFTSLAHIWIQTTSASCLLPIWIELEFKSHSHRCPSAVNLVCNPT